MAQPREIDWDTEFEDPETSLWWVDMSCVDCLRVANDRRRARRRERLEHLLAWFARHPEAIPEGESDQVLEVLGRLAEQVAPR